jgi:hypothetical protein
VRWAESFATTLASRGPIRLQILDAQFVPCGMPRSNSRNDAAHLKLPTRWPPFALPATLGSVHCLSMLCAGLGDGREGLRAEPVWNACGKMLP